MLIIRGLLSSGAQQSVSGQKALSLSDSLESRPEVGVGQVKGRPGATSNGRGRTRQTHVVTRLSESQGAWANQAAPLLLLCDKVL